MSRNEAFKDGHSFMERRAAQLKQEGRNKGLTHSISNDEMAAQMDQAWHNANPGGYYKCQGPGGTHGCGLRTDDPAVVARHTAAKGPEHYFTGIVKSRETNRRRYRAAMDNGTMQS